MIVSIGVSFFYLQRKHFTCLFPNFSILLSLFLCFQFFFNIFCDRLACLAVRLVWEINVHIDFHRELYMHIILYTNMHI